MFLAFSHKRTAVETDQAVPRGMAFWKWLELRASGTCNMNYSEGWNDNASSSLNCCDRFETLYDFL